MIDYDRGFSSSPGSGMDIDVIIASFFYIGSIVLACAIFFHFFDPHWTKSFVKGSYDSAHDYYDIGVGKVYNTVDEVKAAVLCGKNEDYVGGECYTKCSEGEKRNKENPSQCDAIPTHCMPFTTPNTKKGGCDWPGSGKLDSLKGVCTSFATKQEGEGGCKTNKTFSFVVMFISLIAVVLSLKYGTINGVIVALAILFSGMHPLIWYNTE
jgi:hypothetical protein